MKRQVYFVSDSTGITVEALGHSLLLQFADMKFEHETFRYVDTIEKVQTLCHSIATYPSEQRPLVFCTMVDGRLRAEMSKADAHVFDVMGEFLTPLEEVLGQQAKYTKGLTHGQGANKHYEHRMNAVNFTLTNDDGISDESLDHADLILIGPSRCGKTPTCLYLAMQYGVFAANYPLVEEDFELMRLPDSLAKRRGKLYGLQIDPQRLHQIRDSRRPDSEYASLQQCRYEVNQIAVLYRENQIPVCDVTQRSIEEIATRILPHLHTLP